jgi:hypothetical protein
VKRHTRISTILSKPTIHGHAMRLKMLAQQQLPPPAVEALPTQLAVVSADPLPHLEPLHILAHARHDADGLMARDQGKLGQKLALVDVQVGAADAAGFDFDEDVIVAEFGEGHLDDSVVFWFGVSVGRRRWLARLGEGWR